MVRMHVIFKAELIVHGDRDTVINENTDKEVHDTLMDILVDSIIPEHGDSANLLEMEVKKEYVKE